MNGVKGLVADVTKGYTTSHTWNKMHFVLENYINGKGGLNLSEEGGLLVHGSEIIVNRSVKIVWGKS